MRVGSRQHAWLYGGPDCWDAKPYQFTANNMGNPPPVLRDLVKCGLMWAEKRPAFWWGPRADGWRGPRPGPEHWCGLTDKGLALIRERRLKR